MKRTALVRRTPLRAKKPLQRKCWHRSKPLKSSNKPMHVKRTPLRKVSKKQAARLRNDYYPLQSHFLRQPANELCFVCLAVSLDVHVDELRETAKMMPPEKFHQMMLASGARINKATEAHHRNGRLGALLTYLPWLIPSCRGCREFPHDCRAHAKRLGLIGGKHEYDVVTDEVRAYDFRAAIGKS